MSATAIKDIQRLVECQSPTEDLAACVKVVELAVEISAQVLEIPAKLITENGRPVFGGELKSQRLFCFVT